MYLRKLIGLDPLKENPKHMKFFYQKTGVEDKKENQGLC